MTVAALILSSAVNEDTLSKVVEIGKLTPDSGYNFIGKLSDTSLSSEETLTRVFLCESRLPSDPTELQLINLPVDASLWRLQLLNLLESIDASLTKDTYTYYYLKHLFQKRFAGRLFNADANLNVPGHRHLSIGWQWLQLWQCTDTQTRNHQDVRDKGKGLFSIWRGHIYLSSLDGSDPRVNGRSYRLHKPHIYEETIVSGVRIFTAVMIGMMILYYIIFYAWPRLRRNKIWQNLMPGIVISCIMLVGIALISEIYFRFTIPFKEPVRTGRIDPVLGHMFFPNTEIRATNHTEFWIQSYSNSLGFLDREPVIPKPANTFRILFLGDSFVEAAQVAIKDKFHVHIETALRRRFPNRQFDTVAMAFSGTGQSNQLPLLEKFGKDIAPDLVVLVAVNNDFANNSSIIEGIRHGWKPDHPPRAFFHTNRQSGAIERILIETDPNKFSLPIPDAGSHHANLIARIKYLSQNAEIAHDLAGWRFPEDAGLDLMFFAESMPKVFNDALKYTRHTIKVFKQHGKRGKFHVVLATTPNVSYYPGAGTAVQDSVTFDRKIVKERQLQRMKAIANDIDLPFVDLMPYILKHGDFFDARFPYDGHWNETGHKWIAEAFVEYLTKNPQLLVKHAASAN